MSTSASERDEDDNLCSENRKEKALDQEDDHIIYDDIPVLRESNSDQSLIIDVSVPYNENTYQNCNSENEPEMRCNVLNFLYTNARSLTPKVKSLVELFDNLNLYFAAISETWLVNGRKCDRNVDDLEHGEGLTMIAKNRRSRGGGVAIIFNKNKMTLKRVGMKEGGLEVVAAVGRTVEDSRKLLIISAYYPPQMKRQEVDKLNECISNTIDSQKLKHEALQIIVCGDMNKKDIIPVLTDHPDVKVLHSPSTRRGETIDL